MDYKELWHKIITRLQATKGVYLDLTEATLGSIGIGTGKTHGRRSYAYTCRIAAKSSQGDGQISLWSYWFCGETSYCQTVAAVGVNEPMHIGLVERTSGNEKSAGIVAILNIKEQPSPRLAEIIGDWITDCIREETKAARSWPRKSAKEELLEYAALGASAMAGDKHAQQELGGRLTPDSADEIVKECLKWLELSANAGHAESQFQLGCHHRRLANLARDGGYDEEGNTQILKAAEWFTKAAEQSHAQAAYAMVEYNNQINHEPPRYFDEVDETEPAFNPGASNQGRQRWLTRAAELGHDQALYEQAQEYMRNPEISAGDCRQPEEHRLNRLFGLNQLRQVASRGYLEAIRELAVFSCSLQHPEITVSQEEMFIWRLKGAELGDPKCQMLLAESYRFGAGTPPSMKMAKEWYAHCARRQDIRAGLGEDNPQSAALGLLGNLYLYGDEAGGRDVLRATDAWQRCYKQTTFNHVKVVMRYEVLIRRRHLLLKNSSGKYLIVDTGSDLSPTLGELDARFPGIRAHLSKLLGDDVVGIFGNDQLLSGSGFVLDLREGDKGELWITEAGLHKPLDRLPCIKCMVPARPIRAFIDTGAQYSYTKYDLPQSLRSGSSATDFSVLSGKFETHSVTLYSCNIEMGSCERHLKFGRLPEHIADRAFARLGADTIIGAELLMGSIFSWCRHDNTCFIEEAAHAGLASLFIGTDLNRVPRMPVRPLQEYYLKLLEPNSGPFRQDLRIVMEGANEQNRSGWILPEYFEAGGRADHLKGRRRTMFVVACYFSVLIDQAFHHHFSNHHDRYERLAAPPKLYEGIFRHGNINPSDLLRLRHLRDEPCADAVFREAIPVVESQLKALVRQYFEALNPDDVWQVIQGHLPSEGPIFT